MSKSLMEFAHEYSGAWAAHDPRYCRGKAVHGRRRRRLTMRDGLVGRKDTYLDWLAYQRQVGIDPVATFKALGS